MALEAHRRARAEGRHRGHHAAGELSDPRWWSAWWKASRYSSAVAGSSLREVAQTERREHQTDARDEREQPRRQLADVVEEPVDDDALEQRHAQTRERAGHGGKEHDFA